MIELTKNDSMPSLQYTVTRSCSGSTTPNLTDYSATIKVRKLGASTNAFTITVTSSGNSNGQITSPTSGVLRFDWSTSHWGTTGTYLGEISLTNGAGKIETAPTIQAFNIRSEF